jgi:hypothetical protein
MEFKIGKATGSETLGVVSRFESQVPASLGKPMTNVHAPR